MCIGIACVSNMWQQNMQHVTNYEPTIIHVHLPIALHPPIYHWCMDVMFMQPAKRRKRCHGRHGPYDNTFIVIKIYTHH